MACNRGTARNSDAGSVAARGGAGRVPACLSKKVGNPSLQAAPLQFLSHPDGESREGPGPEHVATLPAARSNKVSARNMETERPTSVSRPPSDVTPLVGQT